MLTLHVHPGDTVLTRMLCWARCWLLLRARPCSAVLVTGYTIRSGCDCFAETDEMITIDPRDSNVVYVAAQGPLWNSGGDRGVYKTSDGGATWDKLSSTWCPDERSSLGSRGQCFESPYSESFIAPPDGSIVYSSSPPGWVSEMDFFNQTGWILEDDSGCWPCYGNPPAPAYWSSVDGASTWRQYPLPAPKAEPDLFDQYWRCYPQQLNLLSEEIVRLVVACWDKRQGENPLFSGPGEAAYLYASGDGGASWETYPLPPAVEWRLKVRPTGPVGEGKVRMIFVNETDGMLFGREMFRTTDAGVTWIPINTVNWDGEFSFVDPWLGWAIARNEDERALVYTEDGGETWQILNPVGWP